MAGRKMAAAEGPTKKRPFYSLGPESHFFRGSELGGRTGMRVQRPQSRRDGLCRWPPGRPLLEAVGTASTRGRQGGLYLEAAGSASTREAVRVASTREAVGAAST